MKNVKQNAGIWIILAAAAVFLLVSLVIKLNNRTGKIIEVSSGYRVVMGTIARITVITDSVENGQKSINAAFDCFQNIEDMMSYHLPDSQLSLVNHNAFGHAVPVSDDLFEVIKKSIEFGKLSDGAFDITIGPVEDLYRAAEKQNILPTDEQIAAAKAKTGYEKIIIDEKNKTVRFAVDGMKLDLGGIAKGFAVDKAYEILKANGAVGGLVDLGGNIRCFLTPAAPRKTWLIDLQDPNVTESDMSGKSLLVLKLQDMSVSTSGDYRRFETIGGKKFSHIIDPRKASSSSELSSVTILAASAADADALSTAVTVLGEKKGLELIASIPDTKAIIITAAPEFKMTKSSGADAFIK